MFLLRTFGALELIADDGSPVDGAAAQRKPLLILALAALVPGGVPRERLLRALWPDANATRARATLKQHLYALRRATGNAQIITGSPRLRIATDTVRVDALEFLEHVDGARLRVAAEFLRGQLLEEIREGNSPVLDEMVRELRQHYAPRIALVRQAVTADALSIAMASGPPSPSAPIAAERGVASASRRFSRGMIAVPLEMPDAFHRAQSCMHDLLEALAVADRASVPDDQVAAMLGSCLALWHRVPLIASMRDNPPGARRHADVVAQIMAGVRHPGLDPVASALERAVIASPLAHFLRMRSAWEGQQLARTVTMGAPGERILILGTRGTELLAQWGGVVASAATAIVICVEHEEAAAVLRLRFSALDGRLTVLVGDPFAQFDGLRARAAFGLILTGDLLDAVDDRASSWITAQLVGLLAGGGALALSSLAADHPDLAWLRHIVDWEFVGRTRDELVAQFGAATGCCALSWDTQLPGEAWFCAATKAINTAGPDD